jgi:hypothetical protein
LTSGSASYAAFTSELFINVDYKIIAYRPTLNVSCRISRFQNSTSDAHQKRNKPDVFLFLSVGDANGRIKSHHTDMTIDIRPWTSAVLASPAKCMAPHRMWQPAKAKRAAGRRGARNNRFSNAPETGAVQFTTGLCSSAGNGIHEQ